MSLLFDIGNTRLKWALIDSGKIARSGVMDVSDLNVAKLSENLSDLDQPKSILISNVGSNQILETVQNWLESNFNIKPSIIKVSQSACGIQNGYKDIASLGVDRWVAIIGARKLVLEGDIIVIDAGTALTIDYLSANNVFEGGVILPGLALMHDSLVGRTAGIKSEVSDGGQIIGKTTKECVNSGVSYGLGGAVERIVKEMNEAMNTSSKLILTGGGAKSLLSKIDIKTIYEPNLVLLGLLELASL